MTIELEVKALQKLNMFRDVAAAKLKLLAMVSDRVTFRQGDAIFTRGEQSDAVFIVLDGSIALTFTPEDGEGGSALTLRHSGSILLGEVGILCGKKRSVTIIATSSLTALRIPGEDFMRLIRETPELAFAVMRQLAEQVDLKSRYLAENLTSEAAASQ
jgi:CRP-like cAMP-binding protein